MSNLEEVNRSLITHERERNANVYKYPSKCRRFSVKGIFIKMTSTKSKSILFHYPLSPGNGRQCRNLSFKI